MRPSKLTNSSFIYWLAFALALALRLFRLGAAPLSETEAGWALQALGLAHGSPAAIAAQPAYILITSQLFSIFGDTNFLARLLPALAGSLLVWLPFLFRRLAGDSVHLQRAGWVLAFGLALDPGLVSLSRQAGSLMPALAFSLLALACLYQRRMVWLGMFAGLALLSGAAFLQIALILGLSWGFYLLLKPKPASDGSDESPNESSTVAVTKSQLLTAVAALAGTLLVAGTLFLRAPQGVGALAETFTAYLDKWLSPSGIPLLRLPTSLLIYQPLVLIFALVSLGRLWLRRSDEALDRNLGSVLAIWALVAFLLPLLYPGRQVGDLAVLLIPLWALAALEISRSLSFEADQVTHIVAAALGLLLLVLSVVGWINLLSIGRYQVNVVPYWAIIIGALLLGFIALLLVAAGWSSYAARLGAVWAVCLVLGLQLVSNTWGMSILRGNSAQDFWSSLPSTGQAAELSATLADISSWSTGLRDQLKIVVLSDSASRGWAALRWELRHYPQVDFATSLQASAAPPVVITLKDAQPPSLAEKYRGQDFIWTLTPGWQGALPANFINWLAFRQAELAQQQIILWVRVDIFPGGASSTSSSPAP